MARRKKNLISLFVDGGQIVDQDGSPVTIERARELWETTKIFDYNLAFLRLATKANWDFEELERQYAEMDKARGR